MFKNVFLIASLLCAATVSAADGYFWNELNQQEQENFHLFFATGLRDALVQFQNGLQQYENLPNIRNLCLFHHVFVEENTLQAAYEYGLNLNHPLPEVLDAHFLCIMLQTLLLERIIRHHGEDINQAKLRLRTHINETAAAIRLRIFVEAFVAAQQNNNQN